MKNAILLLFILVFGSTVYAQTENPEVVPVDEDTKLITYQEVIEEAGTPEMLYDRAISWINSFYTNPDRKTKVRDRTGYKIVIKAGFKIYDIDKEGTKLDAGVINYEFTLEFKQDRFRYTITNFSLAASSFYALERWLDREDPSRPEKAPEYLTQVNKYIDEMLDSLEEGMKPEVKKEDNW